MAEAADAGTVFGLADGPLQEKTVRNRWPEETEPGTEDQAAFKKASKPRAA